MQGFAHIFRWSIENPDDKTDDSFPVWAIIVISVGSLIIIGIIVGCIIFQRKKKIGSYTKFTN